MHQREEKHDQISVNKSWWEILIEMFFHNVKKMVHGDIAPVGKMAAEQNINKHFVSEVAK